MSQLSDAIQLREDGKPENALIILSSLLNDYPNDAQVNYQYAWCCDVLGNEREAIPYYLKALKFGLKGNDRKEAYIGLGSTYRTIGEYGKSESVLSEALNEYDDNAIRVFMAMTKYNLNKHDESMEILLSLIADTSNDKHIQQFDEAIRYYADKLNKIWP